MTLKGVLECLPELEIIKKSVNNNKKLKIINQCSNRVFYAICEICRNIINGVIPLSSSNLNKLKKHKDLLRKLSQKKISLATRKKLIIQQGGALSTILVPALTFLASLFLQKSK